MSETAVAVRMTGLIACRGVGAHFDHGISRSRIITLSVWDIGLRDLRNSGSSVSWVGEKAKNLSVEWQFLGIQFEWDGLDNEL